jgi:hypothetical protein
MRRGINDQPAARQTEPQPGSAAALLDAARECADLVRPGDVEELERLIAEGCEQLEKIEDPLA